MKEFNIQIFKNSRFGEVRVTEIDGELHFVAKDVAERLGYTWNGLQRIEHVPEEWRGVTSVVTPSGTQEVITLSEQGLYFFLARSDKPDALPFQKWIAGEVLPSIRRHGGYLTPARTEELLMNPDLLIQLATSLKTEREEKERLRITSEAQQKRISVLEPKAKFMDRVMDTDRKIVTIIKAA